MLPVSNSFPLTSNCPSLFRHLHHERKIAWSRLGCIAYVSHDGLQVVVRHLICSPADGKWSLSEEYPQHHIVQHHIGQRLLHLCWNEIGSDLAVLDASGRVSILTINAALNNLAVSRQAIADPSDDGAQVVGMMWLNSNRAVCSHALLKYRMLPRCISS